VRNFSASKPALDSDLPRSSIEHLETKAERLEVGRGDAIANPQRQKEPPIGQPVSANRYKIEALTEH
jgi:hypothetical protein